MKTVRNFVFSIILVTTLIMINCKKSTVSAQNQDEFTDLTWEYLGQEPPGTTPELFAPSVISIQDHFVHSAPAFSPDKSEVFWSSRPDGQRYCKLFFMKMINGRWTAPEVASFNMDNDMNHPVFSIDGNTLYYDMGNNIWTAAKQGDSWSEPEQLPPVINSSRGQTMLCTTANGSIYFTRYNFVEGEGVTPSTEEIYVSRKINGNYAEPEKLEKNINSEYARELDVFVAPDESYMIIEEENNRDQHSGLCISYKLNDGSWSERIIIDVGWARFPYVSPDGNYLFFVRIGTGVFWVNTSFIEDLKPDELR
ncbi:hypothetical protein ACFL4T_09925 [candidate division KSB1 bacterium]